MADRQSLLAKFASSAVAVLLAFAVLSSRRAEAQGEPDWRAKTASVLQQVSQQEFLSSFAAIFSEFLQGGQQPITAPATLLVPTNVGHWRYLSHWTALSPTHQRRLLHYHILPGRYTAQQLLDAPPLTLFPTFNHHLPLNKTLKPEEVFFQSVPLMKSASPLNMPDAGLTEHLAAHGVTSNSDDDDEGEKEQPMMPEAKERAGHSKPAAADDGRGKGARRPAPPSSPRAAVRYTKSVLSSTLQLMGCKSRHAVKISERVFQILLQQLTSRRVSGHRTDVAHRSRMANGSDGIQRFARPNQEDRGAVLATGASHDNHSCCDSNGRDNNEQDESRAAAGAGSSAGGDTVRGMSVSLKRSTFLDVVCRALAEYRYLSADQRSDLALACNCCGKSTLASILVRYAAHPPSLPCLLPSFLFHLSLLFPSVYASFVTLFSSLLRAAIHPSSPMPLGSTSVTAGHHSTDSQRHRMSSFSSREQATLCHISSLQTVFLSCVLSLPPLPPSRFPPLSPAGASRLGITTVVSTDSLRHMMRGFSSREETKKRSAILPPCIPSCFRPLPSLLYASTYPLLYASTYQAGEHLDPAAVADTKARKKAGKLAGKHGGAQAGGQGDAGAQGAAAQRDWHGGRQMGQLAGEVVGQVGRREMQGGVCVGSGERGGEEGLGSHEGVWLGEGRVGGEGNCGGGAVMTGGGGGGREEREMREAVWDGRTSVTGLDRERSGEGGDEGRRRDVGSGRDAVNGKEPMSVAFGICVLCCTCIPRGACSARAFTSHMPPVSLTSWQMELLKRHPTIIPFVIYIGNEAKHMERFAVRAKYMTLDPWRNNTVDPFLQQARAQHAPSVPAASLASSHLPLLPCTSPASLGPHATCASTSPCPPMCYQLPLPGRYVLSLHLLFSATFPLLRSNARTSFLGGFSNYTVVQSQAIQASAPPTFSLYAHSVPRGNGSIYPPINSSTGELISTGVCQQPDSAFFFHGENFNGYRRAVYKVRAAEGRPAAAFNLTYVWQCGAMKPVLPAWMSDPALVGPALTLFDSRHDARGAAGSSDARSNSSDDSSSTSSGESNESSSGREGPGGEYDMALVGTTLHDLIQHPTARAFGALLESNLLPPLRAAMRDPSAVAVLGPWAAREDSKPPEFIPVSNNARSMAFENELIRRVPSTQPGALSALGMMGLTLPRPDLCPDSTHYAWPVTLAILDLWLTPLCTAHASHGPQH
ncbi:unnamed protein product [Closterium sp. NIES-65]|nr:unnamed protein product [Closterium sp. NIES-65]